MEPNFYSLNRPFIDFIYFRYIPDDKEEPELNFRNWICRRYWWYKNYDNYSDECGFYGCFKTPMAQTMPLTFKDSKGLHFYTN